MTDFEFLSVLISIVIGLGLTHLLKGLGSAIYLRHLNGVDQVHAAWTVAIFVILVLNWWVALLWRDFDTWSFGVFFALVLWTTSLYALSLALYPPNLPDDVDYRLLFEQNRNWILGTFVLMTMLDMFISWLREGVALEVYYMVYVGHYALLALLGLAIRRRAFDLFLAWYIVVTLLLWSFGIRGTLW